MKAVVLAGGKGTRLNPLTLTRPKATLKIANKPIIVHILDELYVAGVEEVFIVTSYLEDKVKSLLKNASGMKITFLHQEKTGGTGDALKCASGRLLDDFLVINGDEVFEKGSFSKIIKKFSEKSANGIVAVCKSEKPERYGVVIYDNNECVDDIVEKSKNPPSEMVNAGAYMFSPKIFDYLERIELSKRGEYELTDAIKLMSLETRKVYVCDVNGWQGVSEIWDILDANTMKLGEMFREEKYGKPIIGKDVIIKPGVHIEGDVIIGDGSVIGPNCYIRGSTSIGDNCRIGNGVEIKNSIIMDNSNVPHLSYVGDSVIGENCNLGAGSIVANLRHDKKNVSVMNRGKLSDSGLRKLGVFMGDWTKTGIGTTLYPGVILGPFSWTSPNSIVDRNIEPFSILGVNEKTRISKEKIGCCVKDDSDRIFLEHLYESLNDLSV